MADAAKIAFFIVHHNATERLDHIRPACSQLADLVNGSVQEIFEQPDDVTVSRWSSVEHAIMFARMERLWAHHRKINPPSLSTSITSVIRQFHNVYLGPEAVSTWKRWYAGAETTIGGKHHRAWATCPPDADYVVVLEDDAVFGEESEIRFFRLLDKLDQRADPDRLLYVDLAGGLDPVLGLGTRHLISAQHEGITEYELPVTNCAGGYLMSAKTARVFTGILQRQPWFATAVSDWSINMVMRQCANDGMTFDCWHTTPPIFQNGSLTGVYKRTMDGSPTQE